MINIAIHGRLDSGSCRRGRRLCWNHGRAIWGMIGLLNCRRGHGTIPPPVGEEKCRDHDFAPLPRKRPNSHSRVRTPSPPTAISQGPTGRRESYDISRSALDLEFYPLSCNLYANVTSRLTLYADVGIYKYTSSHKRLALTEISASFSSALRCPNSSAQASGHRNLVWLISATPATTRTTP